jgi:linoleoyl-CoA desaturase
MSALPAKVSFENGGDFIRDTRREVDLYLDGRRTRLRGNIQLYVKSVVAFGVLAASWASLIFLHPGIALGLLALAGLSLGAILVGFCIQHDANHGAYFRTRRANHLMGWSADALLGISSYAWRVKHNVAHHTYTNVDGYDDDINQTPFARLMPSQQPRRWYRLQHLYIWPLYCVMVIRWQIGADAAAIIRGRIANSALHPPKRWDLTGLVGGKLLFVGWAIVVPLFA